MWSLLLFIPLLNSLRCRFGRCRFHFLLRREVQLMDGIGGAHIHTLAAHTALRVVDVREVVLNGDGLELALLQTE